MNTNDPAIAQQIVVEYARHLERRDDADDWPARADLLPYPKPTIKSAIRTSTAALTSTGQLTSELQQFLEDAYVALADYVAPDLARLLTEFQHAAADLAADARFAREKTGGAAWRTVAETGSLAGSIARTIADEAAALREEFRTFAP